MASAKGKQNEVNVPVVRYRREKAVVRIKGITPIICHRFGTKAKNMIAGKQAGKAKQPHGIRQPEAEYQESLYMLPKKQWVKKNGGVLKHGIPAIWFKNAILYMAKEVKAGTAIKRNVLIGNTMMPGELLPLEYDPKIDPHMRIGEDGTPGDMVRVGMGSADIRYRGEFYNWEVAVPILFNADAISLEQIVSWLDAAGTGSGCGEWRPSSPKNPGTCGMWEIADGGTDGQKKTKKKRA